jgi:hypothetical protein
MTSSTKLVVAVLDTMWGERNGRAPRWFPINPQNHSGRRLYKLVGACELLVTNACPQLVNHATRHGKPDPKWLAENLARLEPALILACGNVAQRTLKESGFRGRTVKIPHPAARIWTKKRVQRTARKIKRLMQ